MPLDHLADKTVRLYAAAQADYRLWLAKHDDYINPVAGLAAYLEDLCRTRSPNLVALHRAAVARLYLDSGHPLDTRVPAVQAVLVRARKLIVTKRARLARRALRVVPPLTIRPPR